jgi:ABC-type dipeptide/oligopeptide/nickel transport system ATPase component
MGEHWAIVGKTGSGKTHYAKDLLEYYRVHYPHAKRYVLDSTEDGMEGVVGKMEIRGNRIPDLLKNAAHTQVWVPDTDVPGNYNTYFEKILYARQPAIVFVDEIASLTNGRNTDPLDGFIKLLKQGRKHDITVINLTQEIARVPQSMFKQMTHFVLFRINNETYDISMARKYLDVDKEHFDHPQAKYGFKHKRTDGEYSVKEYQSSQHFFKR